MNIKMTVCAALLLSLPGCSKLTLENYSKIEPGMRFDEVIELIGRPEKCDDVLGLRNCSWGDEKRSVSVTFAGGKVLLFTSSNLN